LWGGVGLAVLVFGFSCVPGSIPGEVLLIILTVIMAASAREAAGGGSTSWSASRRGSSGKVRGT
jgi:anaerobic C4-dicarboxylate transporter